MVSLLPLSFMMKSSINALLILIAFLLIAGRSNGRLLMENKRFISPHNPSALDPNLDSIVDNGLRLHTADGHVEKDAVHRDQKRSPRSSLSEKSATNENKLSFRLGMSVEKTKKKIAEGVFNLLVKGKVTPSGPSPTVTSMATKQELSTSDRSPGVGHMQIIWPRSQTIRVHILKSGHRHGDDHVQQQKSNKRGLLKSNKRRLVETNKRRMGSTPSPGDGN